MPPKRRLPVLTERSISEVQAIQIDLDHKFERQIRGQVSKEGKAINCTPGCASCCYHPIEISVLEGALMYRWLMLNGRWTTALKEKLQQAANQQFGVSYEVWLLSLTPCPMLTADNLCGAYEARPFICRSYYSTGDPHYCHPHRLGPQTELISRDEIVTQFHKEQARVLKGHNLNLTTVPIGEAVLLGERLCKGDIDLEAVDHILLKEYAEKG
jgi:Fe-S-cluster containining protein